MYVWSVQFLLTKLKFAPPLPAADADFRFVFVCQYHRVCSFKEDLRVTGPDPPPP